METLTEIRDFLDKFGFLTFGRDISIIRVSRLINGNIVLDSATRTMESIRYCGMNGNFADAYSLLRKFRDDLFCDTRAPRSYTHLCASSCVCRPLEPGIIYFFFCKFREKLLRGKDWKG